MSGAPRSDVPEARIRIARDRPAAPEAAYVLYWMTAFRRTRYNFALQRAVDWSKHLEKPLVVIEALGCGYPWASDRIHRFVIEGMRDNADRFRSAGVTCLSYVEPRRGAGRGLVKALADRACVVVADDFPEFTLPRLVERAASRSPVRFEAIDANGILPLADTQRVFPTAFSFRAWIQKRLPDHLEAFPRVDPLRGMPRRRRVSLDGILRKWPEAGRDRFEEHIDALATLPIDHSVGPVDLSGGERAARRALRRFLRERLDGYATDRNDVGREVTSGLSPYLHFGQIGSHEVVRDILKDRGWSRENLGKPRGKRSGWWGMDEAAEAFLDQIITWRELGFNMSRHRPDHARWEALPGWAKETLTAHAADRRDPAYAHEDLEAAQTHDPLWNAAQTQLVREGTIHNYLRMLWGKKILEWTRTPRKAIEVMIDLNNKYALDGRDPNSYSGIFWCLGRYDRPWGPERRIFGKIRYMSSDSTRRKMRVTEYLDRYGQGEDA